jgi:hypothetical protein
MSGSPPPTRKRSISASPAGNGQSLSRSPLPRSESPPLHELRRDLSRSLSRSPQNGIKKDSSPKPENSPLGAAAQSGSPWEDQTFSFVCFNWSGSWCKAPPPLVTQRLGREQLKSSPPLYIFVAVVWFQFFRFGVQKSSKFTSAFEHLHIYVFMEMMLDNLYCHVAHIALSTLESFLNVLLLNVLLSSTLWDLGPNKMQAETHWKFS